MANPVVSGWLARWASGLRFPWLLAITAGVFVIDLLVPDLLPFADEVLLGLLTIVLASIRRRRREPQAPDAPDAPDAAAPRKQVTR